MKGSHLILFCTVMSKALLGNGFTEGDEIITVRQNQQNGCNQDKIYVEMKILHNRITSLEQPIWRVSSENFRWVDCSEGPCECIAPSFAVSCYRLSLDRIPERQRIPNDVLTLDIGSNQLLSLHQNVFKHFHRLIQINLANNLLEYLPQHIFDEVRTLKHLHLQRNRLESLHPQIFKDLVNLETLDLSENMFMGFIPDHWEGLNSLITLQLSSNQISTWEIGSDTLSKLEFLDLSDNSLSRLPQMEPNQLKILKLNRNNLSTIEPGAFLRLELLQELYLHENNFEEIPPSIFQGLNSLKILDLSENGITNISEKSSWSDLKSLEELRIHRNLIETLQNRGFKELNSLERLILTGNNIEVIEPLAFEGLGKLLTLLLTNNIIRYFNATVFEPLQNLTKLYLDNNQIVSIEENTLESMKKLKRLKIGNNPWQCDCSILYLTNWLLDHPLVSFDYESKCQTPGKLAGKPIQFLKFVDVCEEQ